MIIFVVLKQQLNIFNVFYYKHILSIITFIKQQYLLYLFFKNNNIWNKYLNILN